MMILCLVAHHTWSDWAELQVDEKWRCLGDQPAVFSAGDIEGVRIAP